MRLRAVTRAPRRRSWLFTRSFAMPSTRAASKLYLAGLDEVDAALAARILLAADRNLERYQRDGVAAFVASEEARVAARIASTYTDRDEGFERFRARVLAAPAGGR